jgi:hypothetical protein
MKGHIIRAVLLLLAMTAMGMRAVAPPGYMVSAGDGRVAITLCNGASASIDLGKDHGKGTRGEASPCVFAAVAHAAAPVAAIAAPALRFAFVDTAPVAPARIGEGLAAPPPPSTGPPLNA